MPIYNEYRSSYIKFANWYNEVKPDVPLEVEKALCQLHDMWLQDPLDKDINWFYSMKQYHSIINEHLLNKTDNRELDTPYDKYIVKGLEFRVRFLRESVEAHEKKHGELDC